MVVPRRDMWCLISENLVRFHWLLQWKVTGIIVENILSKSESVKFSLIESVICLFTVKSVNFHWFISEKIFFTVKSVNFHCNNQWNLTDLQ